jgi:hypothetical protein
VEGIAEFRSVQGRRRTSIGASRLHLQNSATVIYDDLCISTKTPTAIHVNKTIITHPSVITMFIGGINMYKPFPVMGGFLLFGWWFWNMFYVPMQLGISSSQLTFTPSFFRGVGLNHQPD